MLETNVDVDTGAPTIKLYIAELDGGDVVEEVGHILFTPQASSFFAINLLHAAAYVEAQSATITAMRAHKIEEETITKVVNEADRLRRARRQM